MNYLKKTIGLVAAPVALIATIAAITSAESDSSGKISLPASSRTVEVQTPVFHRTIEIEGQQIFYREAGSSDHPTVLLLHGFPTSSHMFRNLIPELAGQYHVVAPDYPGFGQSSMPSVDEFEKFTLKKGIKR
jgi:hypothetical protein